MNMSPLVDDYMHAYENTSRFFNGDFRDLAAFQDQAEKIRSLDRDRGPLIAVLAQQNRDFGCGGQTLENIERLSRDRACAVVTGQQVGLFSGPLYTIYKSLTAIKLAEHLNQRLSGSFVPVFWLASDDHDFAEIDHIDLLDLDNQIEKVRYKSRTSRLKIPAAKRVFSSQIENCLERLSDLTRDSEFKAEILANLREAYRTGRSFADAFARWMARLFDSFGLILVDGSHPELKRLGKKIFALEIGGYSPSTVNALRTADELNQANYHQQVQLREGLLNLFFIEKERKALRWKGDEFFIKETGGTYSRSELLELLDENPDMFSPNVLLRPIYQDYLFPTVAYVGGPGEIAYFAQMKKVYESYDVPMPIIYPRKTVTVIEKHVDAVLYRYGIKVQDVWQEAQNLVKEIAKKQIPASIDRVFRMAATHIREDFQAIKQEIKTLEATLEGSVDLAFGRVDRQLKILEDKVSRASQKRDQELSRQLHRAVNSLYPLGVLQERVFNIVPFLIKYGYPFIEGLYEILDMEDHNHQVIRL
jgi:bacillithiol biosynthesis cysteine-adding enzyme BshC